MIRNKEKCYYLAVKELPSLLRGITSKPYNDVCCLDFFHFLRTKNKLEWYKKVCKNKAFCNAIMLF